MLVKIVVVLVLCQAISLSQAGVIGRGNKQNKCSLIYQPCNTTADCCSTLQMCYQRSNGNICVAPSDPSGLGPLPTQFPAGHIKNTRPSNPGCGFANETCNENEKCCATLICNDEYKCATPINLKYNHDNFGQQLNGIPGDKSLGKSINS